MMKMSLSKGSNPERKASKKSLAFFLFFFSKASPYRLCFSQYPVKSKRSISAKRP
jgi:hypothetical protein